MLDWKPPYAKWFVGAKTNVSYNCLDRHLEGPNAWRRNKAAIIWEGEPGDTRVLTYGELHREVCKFANVLKALGVAKGDRVAIYMPMIPELAIAMLACTRIGAPHSVVFGGFSAEALRDRINDAGAKLVVTADGGYRRGAPFALKPAVDEALAGRPDVEQRRRRAAHRRRQSRCSAGRDHWWHDADEGAPRPTARPRSSTPSTRSSSSTRAAPPASRRASCTRPAATSRTSRRPRKAIFDLKDERHLLVHGRHRLGHRPLLRRLRPARERRDHVHVRGRARRIRAPIAAGTIIER